MAVANAPEYGGYDYKFSGQVPERFMCNICTKVLREPHLTVCCGQHFCESCLNHWFQKQGKKSCPHCRENSLTHVPNKALKREINGLKIHCTHHNEGCQWIGELGNLQTHLDKVCGYVEVECPNKCKLNDQVRKFKRKALQDHLDNECTRRRYKCEYCGHEDMYKDITGKGYRQTYHRHYDECDMYPLDCPNRCGKKQIQRKDMSTHRDKCPEEPVKCLFKVEGCKTRVVRKDFDNHMSTQMLHHMLLLRKECCLLKAESDSLKKAISTNMPSLLKTSTVRLKGDGDSLTIEIPDLSQYKRSREVWRSPPFYIKEGYKMCLAVYPNGIGKGEGTHVSLSLVLMKGEFDDQLEWPIRCDSGNHYVELKVTVMSKQPQQKAYIYGQRHEWFRVNGLRRVHDVQVVQSSSGFLYNRGDTFLKHGTRDEQEMVRGALAEVYMHFPPEEDGKGWGVYYCDD